MYYQTEFLTTLAFLMGENSVNTTTSAPRADFVQETLDEAYKAYPWKFARATATITVTDGVATLPTNYDSRHKSFATFDGGGVTLNLDEVHDEDYNDVVDGDKAAWIEAIGDGDRYILRTPDTNVSTVIFKHQKKTPVLATASTGTPYPNKMTIAMGARRFVKLGQNPDADIGQDQALFEKALARDIASEQVPAVRKRRKTAQGQASSHTGEF